MANRDLTVRIDGDSSGFDKAAKSAAASARVFERELKKVEAATAKQHEAMTDLGKSAMVGGAALAAGLGLAVNAAVKWESAWAGVLKTADTNDPLQLSALEDDLRELARTLPATHTEIAAVAEAAGQLGVSTPNVAAFTKVMIDLGETTNLSADEAATSLAQMMNVMQTAPAEVGRLGAALVALGNNGASTEAEIMAMALRISGVGKQVGMAESDVLAMANALASLGINAEAGGSAISTFMSGIAVDVATGSDELGAFAEVAGMTVAEFSSLFKDDAASAVGAFTDGLGRIQESGGSAIATLQEMGVTEIRQRDLLLRLAGAQGILTDSLKLGREAYAANNALLDEANKRYETTEAKMQVAKNALNELAIDLGSTLLPALAAAAEGIMGLAQFIGDLPEPVQQALVIFTALSSAVLLLGGGALIAIPKVAALKVSLDALGISAAKSATAMRLVGAAAKGLGIAGAFAGAFFAVDQLVKAMADAPPTINEFNSSLQDFAATGRATGALAQVVGADFASLAENLDRASQSKWFSTDFGTTGSDIQEAREQIEGLDAALAGLVQSGQGDVAAEVFGQMEAQVRASGGSIDELNERFAAYGDALVGAEASQKAAANGAGALAGGLGEVGDAAAEQEDSLSDLMDTVKSLSDLVLGLRDASRGYEAALDEASAAIEENGQTLDRSTEAGRANEAALDAIASSAAAVLEQMVAGGAPISEVTAKFNEQRGALIANAEAFGMTSAQASAFADSVLRIPDTSVTNVVLTGAEQAAAQVQRLDSYLRGLPSTKTVSVRYNEVQGTTVARNSPGRVVERASGGFVSGPGTGTSDSIPALLSNGEYVVRASSVAKIGVDTLDGINRYASGGLVGYASGGRVSATDGRSLTTAVRGMDLGSIEAIVAQWERYNEQLEQAARRQELVSGVAQAQRELAVARGTDERARAQESLNDANKAVREFDYAAAREAEASAVERMVDAMERQIALNRETNALRVDQEDNRFDLGAMGSREYLAILDRRMADEVKYSNEWTALYRQREGIIKDEADALSEARDKALDTLDGMLDAEASIRARQVQAEATYYTRRSALAQQFNADQQRILDQRRDSLTSWARLDEVSSPVWGNTVEQLVANAGSQLAQMDEWMSELDAARTRGVSEQVIASLGLDEGPQALGALRQFNLATVGEIEALNAAVGQRTALASQQVAREQRNSYGALGRELTDARQRFAGEVAALDAEFIADQQEMTRELSEIGKTQGRTYGQALAEGLRSELANVQAAARALAAASGGATSTKAAGVAPGPFRSSVGRVVSSGSSGSTVVESHTYVMLDGKVIDQRVTQTLGQQRTSSSIAGVWR